MLSGTTLTTRHSAGNRHYLATNNEYLVLPDGKLFLMNVTPENVMCAAFTTLFLVSAHGAKIPYNSATIMRATHIHYGVFARIEEVNGVFHAETMLMTTCPVGCICHACAWHMLFIVCFRIHLCSPKWRCDHVFHTRNC